MNRLRFLRLWSLAVGAMDASTGLLLVTAPVVTLKWMGIPPLDQAAWVFLSWIGVFVAAVGLSYGWVFRGEREGETVWFFTGLVRLLVAVFLVVKILGGALPMAWITVAITDAVVGAGQWFFVRAGWWRGGDG
ncbi:hypothetical protein JIN85_11570 [Luteolibacter pohnpeiensis]|uniref:Uncharacterized protein n=1 Tax=Luteolibacter pohnpeiensis TaxID=454153 RepID=A0A934VWQ8_9BACT|nr:hypothetical protein [Luteolibacter pohnpeiensis]MBK1883058.1 hypothetical protein [Luteolibacter pohnpeiensis]